jgi:phage baseplate assembly protein W|tara:strand:+ start:138 stop:521 length:384 start_codon:yes stop_codon:yes gene_type:complete
MAGLTPKLPLNVDNVDGAYKLIKGYKGLIQQNLKNLVLTAPGERMMIPDFGVGLRNYLFENDTAQVRSNIRSRIAQQVGKYMPFIELVEVNIFPSFNEEVQYDNSINIQIRYAIPSLNTVDILEISP